VALDGLHVTLLGEHDGAALEQAADALKGLRGGQIDLVEQDPVALLHGLHQGALHERECEVILQLILLDLFTTPPTSNVCQ
jgi:hypothetical protein